VSGKKVGAYITAYRDREAVRGCIQAIREQSYQVAAIFVVDNSPTPLLERSHSLIVRHHSDNIGVGKGIAIGIEWAIDRGYDFLWVFDQDSVPAPNCLEILLEAYEIYQRDRQISIIAPTSFDPRTYHIIQGSTFIRDRFIGCQHLSQVDAYECDAPITSGSLISIVAAKTISYPRADLFIDGVDIDYGMRFRKKGFHNFIVTRAKMWHNFGSPLKIKFLGKERFVQRYSALRYYYICRNHTYLDTRSARSFYYISSYLFRLKYMLLSIVLILLYDPEDKILKIWACLLGTYHGLKGKLGKTWH
jgi:rhamnosyltransferase